MMTTGLFNQPTIPDFASNGAPGKCAFLVIVCSLITLFSFLGTSGLKEPDEGRYAEIGREMAFSNDWLIPRLNGFEHFQKPPMLYWATAASIKLFGVNEWAARLPSALSALGTILFTFWIGSRLFGFKTGTLATVILISSFEYFALARILNTDMMLTFWTTAATAFFLRWTITPEGRRWEWFYFISVGLAFLTKGPVALLAPFSVILMVYVHARWTDAPLPIRWLRGLIIMLVIGLSWFLAVAAIHPELIRYFFGYELFQRTVGAARGREQPVWFYFLVLLIGLFPWSLFFLSALFSRCKNGSFKKISRVDLALGAWIGIPLVILTLIHSKLPTYVLPLFPAIALLVADWIGNRASIPAIRRLVFLTACINVALIGFSFLLPHLSHQMHDLKAEGPLLFLEAALFGMVALLIWLTARREKTLPLLLILGVGSVLAWMVGFDCMDSLDRGFGEQASVRPVSTLLNAAACAPDCQIFCIGTRAHGIEFYTGRFVYESVDKADLAFAPRDDQEYRLIKNDDQWEKNISLDDPVYLVTTRTELTKLTRKWRELGASGSYLLLELDAVD